MDPATMMMLARIFGPMLANLGGSQGPNPQNPAFKQGLSAETMSPLYMGYEGARKAGVPLPFQMGVPGTVAGLFSKQKKGKKD